MPTAGAIGRRRGPWVRSAALGCVVAAALIGCRGEQAPPPATFATDTTVEAEPQAAPTADEAAVQAAAPAAEATEPHRDDDGPQPRPVAVAIPAIDVHAELVPLGLNDDRSMEVPDFGLAGWYAEGPRPGARGPAVIVAHFDSTDGPDVFYDLATLDPGDEVRVHRDDGSVVTFTVEHLDQHRKDELPGDRIWAPTEEPRLTLITCGGVFDRSTDHYTDNVIAYASAADP